MVFCDQRVDRYQLCEILRVCQKRPVSSVSSIAVSSRISASSKKTSPTGESNLKSDNVKMQCNTLSHEQLAETGRYTRLVAASRIC